MKFTNLQAAIVLFVLITCILISTGCTGQDSKMPRGDGLTDVTPQNEFDRASLSSALIAFEQYDWQEITGTTTPDIHYIRGESLDNNGEALGWIIGVIINQRPLLFIYTPDGHQVMDSTTDFPLMTIDPEKILAPDALFRQKSLLIEDLTEGGERDITALEIRDGSYIMTYLSHSTARTFYFDSVTGTEFRQE